MALDKHPGVAALHNTRCWCRALHGVEFEPALSDCNRAIELSSDPASFLDSRALVHFRAGRLKEAFSDYQAALEGAPEQASSLFMAGITLKRMGRSDEGAKAIAAAKAILPSISGFYARFGIKS